MNINKTCIECNKPLKLNRSKCDICRNKPYYKKINENKRKNYDPKKKQAYYQLNKEKIKARTKARHYDKRKNDILYKLTDDIRNRTGKALKQNNFKKTTKFAQYIGCTTQKLKKHLERQFLSGMSWLNRNEWDIDHIIPLASAKTVERLYELCHYTNLQPLWAIDNKKKGAKIA